MFLLLGVPVDRQKLMAKGGWMGTLKDEQDLSGLQIKPGQLIMLMGTADVMKAPAAPVRLSHNILFDCSKDTI